MVLGLSSHIAVRTTSESMFQIPSVTGVEPLYQPRNSYPNLIGEGSVSIAPYSIVVEEFAPASYTYPDTVPQLAVAVLVGIVEEMVSVVSPVYELPV